MQTYANELEKFQMQQTVQRNVPEIRSEKSTASNNVPTSTEMMKKSLDKFGSSFHPTPQVAKKGGAITATSPP